MKNLEKFLNDQLSLWPLACENFRSLKNVRSRNLNAGGLKVILQHNPARMISSAAKLDKESLSKRKCFLCRENRPKEQISIKFEGRKGKKYDILVNPYPIFPSHFVIAMDHHTQQSIWKRYIDMCDMAKAFPKYEFFYNGPRSGASAPDHHHFQAASKGFMPLENDVDFLLDMQAAEPLEYVSSVQDADIFIYRKYISGVFVIRSRTAKSSAKAFYRLLDCAKTMDGSADEPLMNVFVSHKKGEYRTIVVFRTSHRSHHYYSTGEDHLTMSPGCADMAGVFIVPVKEDFDKLDEALLESMLSEVTISRNTESAIIQRLRREQRTLDVGIMAASEIRFEILSDGAGPRKAVLKEGKIEYGGTLFDELFFEAKTLSTMFAEPSFVLYDVTIGVDFHWERKENQKFAGALKIIVDKDRLVAVNVIGIEDYLVSVISSEMKASASEEFLKAHAVISRSWVMSQISRRSYNHPEQSAVVDMEAANVSYIKCYDYSDHGLFDVCADDHCQRYQGLTRAVGETVRKVVDETWGQILVCDGKICDARFSKCCGGMMEEFSTCWEGDNKPYLQSLPDTPDGKACQYDLTREEDARRWIESGDSEAFCNTSDNGILSQVLNSYDLETGDFFRWTREYTVEELSSLVYEKSGCDIGTILDIQPLERGRSGRIFSLRIVGDKRTLQVGKELEIRRVLSESHLKSSAFVADIQNGKVILRGAGWGHGVGLCQIGAAVMAAKGYDYKSILSHYYPDTEIISGFKMK